MRSDGRTPSHLMSGVVKLLLSYDMFFDPLMYTERIYVAGASESLRWRADRARRGLHLQTVRVRVYKAEHRDAQIGLHLLQEKSECVVVSTCFDAKVQRAHRVATSGCPLAVKMTHGKRL